MPFDLNGLEAAVLALPPEQRGYLVERLLASLDDVTDWNDPVEVERAWVEEAMRRRRRFLAGQSKGVPAEEAIARARAGLRRLPENSDEAVSSADTAGVQRAWIEEAESRYQEYLEGGVETRLAPEALGQVRAEIGGGG